MKGPWKVTSNYIGGTKLYAAYRLIDVIAVDHSGNREIGSDYTEDRAAVQAIVDRLNAQEESRETD